MKSSDSDDFSSLDLLLDTICNTFGGIVFLALLLSILAQSAGETAKLREREKLTTPSRVRLESRIVSLREQVETLQQTVDNTPPVAHVEKAPHPAIQKFSEVSESLAKTRWLMDQTIDSRGKAELDIDSLQNQNQELVTKLNELQAAIRNAEPSTEVQRRLPVIEEANPGMNHFWVCIVGRKFYLIDNLPSQGPQGAGMFSTDVTSTRNREGHLVNVRVERGQNVDPNTPIQGSIQRLLAEIRPGGTIIQFFVDKESFSEFLMLKEIMVSRGYRYFLSIGSPPYFFVAGRPTETF